MRSKLFEIVDCHRRQIEIGWFGSAKTKRVDLWPVQAEHRVEPLSTENLIYFLARGGEVHDMIDVGDHAIVIGRVTEARAAGEGSPLVYWSRAYRGVDPQ